MTEIKLGESLVFDLNLFQADGISELNISMLESLSADLMIQNGVAISYTFPSAEFRQGANNNQVILEVLSTLGLTTGNYFLRLTAVFYSAKHTVEQFIKDITIDGLFIIRPAVPQP